mmetsp:Transcript_10059/g.17678  ORF Transcript_10059/g.17678 Transcript_10059/m.17678 type:complete len:432 (+) Transcript_10059:388-1683(+)
MTTDDDSETSSGALDMNCADELSRTSVSKESSKKKHKIIGFFCDGCKKSPIVGTRYHCTICENFDLCEDCFVAPIAMHEPSHMYCFQKIPGPEVSRKRLKVAEQAPVPEIQTEDDIVRVDVNEDDPPTLEQEVILGPSINNDKVDPFVTATNQILKQNHVPTPVNSYDAKSAVEIKRYFSIGWDAFKSIHLDIEEESFCSQIICSNAVIMSGLAAPVLRQRQPIQSVTSRTICALFLSIVAQFKHGDLEKWFSFPVPKHEPFYYQIITKPMDLGTLERKIKITVSSMKSPMSTFSELSLDLLQIWRNALSFGPSAFSVKEAAKIRGTQASAMLKLLASNLGPSEFPWLEFKPSAIIQSRSIERNGQSSKLDFTQSSGRTVDELERHVDSLNRDVLRLSGQLHTLIAFVESSFGHASQKLAAFKQGFTGAPQ